MDEEILVRRLQQGDREAFDALYMLHRDAVLRTACLITGNRTDGEDVTQEAFVQCYQRIGQLRDPKLFRAWLFRAMTRMAWKQCRVRRREQPVDVLFGQDTHESALCTVLRTEQSRRLYEAVLSLDDKHRTVVVLYYFSDMAVRDIARVLQCREGTVKSRLHTARQNLKNHMEPERLEEVWT